MASSDSIACDIVIPYHPATLHWVSAAVESALNQQGADCIVHIVADAVPRKDREHVERCFQDAPNVRFYANETSIGPYQSVHKIFSHLETDYIAIQDSDDISLPHRIWHSITSLQEHSADIFGGAMENFIDWRFKSDAKVLNTLKRQGAIMKSGIIWDNCPHGWIANPTMVVSTQAFKSLNGFADLFTGADIEFSERAYHAGVKRYFSDTIVLLRRLHSTSLSSDPMLGIGQEYFNALSKKLIHDYSLYPAADDLRQFGCLHTYSS